MKRVATVFNYDPPTKEEMAQYNIPGIPPGLTDDVTAFWPYLIAEIPLRAAIGRVIYRVAYAIIKGDFDLEEIKDGIRT